MDATPIQGENPQAGRVEIWIQGHLEPRWSDWLDGLTLTRNDDGTTLVAGPVVDQAALFGVLDRLRDLALPLISVLHVDGPFSDNPTHPTTDQLRSQP